MSTLGIILTLVSITGAIFGGRKAYKYIVTAHTTAPQPTAPQPQPQEQEQPKEVARFEVGHIYEGSEFLRKPRVTYANGRRYETCEGEKWFFEVVGRTDRSIQGHAGEGLYFDIEVKEYKGREVATYYTDNGREFLIKSKADEE